MARNEQLDAIQKYIGDPRVPDAIKALTEVTAIQGEILPFDSYTHFIVLFPVAAGDAVKLQYRTKLVTTDEQTIQRGQLFSRVHVLQLAQEARREITIGPSPYPDDTRSKLEQAALASGQPVAILAFGYGPNGIASTIITIPGFPPEEALSHMSQDLEPSANSSEMLLVLE